MMSQFRLATGSENPGSIMRALDLLFTIGGICMLTQGCAHDEFSGGTKTEIISEGRRIEITIMPGKEDEVLRALSSDPAIQSISAVSAIQAFYPAKNRWPETTSELQDFAKTLPGNALNIEKFQVLTFHPTKNGGMYIMYSVKGEPDPTPTKFPFEKPRR